MGALGAGADGTGDREAEFFSVVVPADGISAAAEK
jgi:hypothetical protein